MHQNNQNPRPQFHPSIQIDENTTATIYPTGRVHLRDTSPEDKGYTANSLVISLAHLRRIVEAGRRYCGDIDGDQIYYNGAIVLVSNLHSYELETAGANDASYLGSPQTDNAHYMRGWTMSAAALSADSTRALDEAVETSNAGDQAWENLPKPYRNLKDGTK